MKPDESTRGFRVSGRVQGVGFRYWTQAHAQDLGLKGYVRNDRDGTVEVFAAGSEPALLRLEALLKKGPPGAQVSALDALPQSDGPLPFPFEIRRQR